MACPHRPDTVLPLPGRAYVHDARRLRQLFEDDKIDVEQFLKEHGHSLLRSPEARFANQTQTYALGSIVIEQYWEFLQGTNVRHVLLAHAAKYKGAPHKERVLGFLRTQIALLDRIRDLFLNQMKATRAKDEPMSKELTLLICFLAVGILRHFPSQKLPVPSMGDLVTMLARIAGIAPTVYKRDRGRDLSTEELFSLLRHPYLLRLIASVMANDRRSMYPLMAKLEADPKKDLNDLGESYNPDCFEIKDENGSLSLRLKPSIIEEHRAHYEKAERRRLKRGKPPRRVLGCPALYTGKLKEIYDWILDNFEQWYVETT